MKEILKIFIIVLVAVFLLPLVWLLVKEVYYLILPLFAGMGNFGWGILLLLAIAVIVWVVSN